MEKIVSRDGTPIAVQRSGDGKPLVLVHGTGGAISRWAPVLPALEEQFSVYAINRRGRGESGDSASYAIEREFEDVAAVVESIGEPTNLLGHSYGAICALEAALLTRGLRRLVLYEPPIPVADVPIYPEGVIDRVETLLERKDREGVLKEFMTRVVRMPVSEFELFRAAPAWPARLAAAHTIPRELRADEDYRFRPERFKTMTTPTLLLLGGNSPAFFKAAIEMLNDALPNTRVVVLPGQQHIAIDTAPELFTRETLSFLNGSE